MPKKPVFETYIYQFLTHSQLISEAQRFLDPPTFSDWQRWIEGLEFIYDSTDTVSVSWQYPEPGNVALDTSELEWYPKGPSAEAKWQNNYRIMEKHVRYVSQLGGLPINDENTVEALVEGRFHRHFSEEERLFGTWAKSVNPKQIDVIQMNESITAPEMRFITAYLGDLQGKTLLDIGCGLGEASVYFALKGAHVTAVDLSQDMLTEVVALARHYNKDVKTLRASIEHLHLSRQASFDIVYAGNIFHHVDIRAALDEVTTFMTGNSILACWEPVAYNPLINIYRRIATHVRSFDERPIRLSDIDIFKEYFSSIELRWFWLTTLVIFIIMIIWQRRNPNKERLWKAVVIEGQKWAWLYRPLETLDRWLLSTFPFLRPLCWNVVIIGSGPKHPKP
jgi:SAM-dependent methyltransferase